MSRGWYSIKKEDEVIRKYLEHIAFTSKKGALRSLSSYKDHFTEHYLNEIEEKMLVYQTDKGLLDIGKEIDPHFFKQIQDEVLIQFKDSNVEKFKVEEAVSLKVRVKNVPELTIKVFEFNTETYYKKNLKPFDTSINLHGMVPSFQRVEKTMFKNVPKNKIVDTEFTFEELKGKIGLFIIEMQGNGKMSRAVVKKGSLTLIHRSTASGHQAFIIDQDKKICKGQRTGVWINKKFYPANPEKNGAIFIPYSKSVQDHSIIMINEDFA
jgi:hypothetical protein